MNEFSQDKICDETRFSKLNHLFVFLSLNEETEGYQRSKSDEKKNKRMDDQFTPVEESDVAIDDEDEGEVTLTVAVPRRACSR